METSDLYSLPPKGRLANYSVSTFVVGCGFGTMGTEFESYLGEMIRMTVH